MAKSNFTNNLKVGLIIVVNKNNVEKKQQNASFKHHFYIKWFVFVLPVIDNEYLKVEFSTIISSETRKIIL